jgi:hypothetical protein
MLNGKESSNDEDLYEKLKIRKIEVSDPEYASEVPARMKNKNFPGFPSTVVFVGMPGSGKTTVFFNLLHNPYMWNKFFDKIHLFGPTVKTDKMYKTIKIDDENICDKAKDFIPKLEKVLDEQTSRVKDDPKTADKVLFIFEDMTAFFDKIQNKPAFQRCYTQIRHLKGTSATMVHKWKAFNRTCRVSSQHILFWNKQLQEMKQLYEDFGPSEIGIEEWIQMVKYCQTPDEKEDKPFLYINMFEPEETRFRKSFTTIMYLNNASLPKEPSLNYSNRRRKRKTEADETRRRRRSRSPEKVQSLTHYESSSYKSETRGSTLQDGGRDRR